MSIEGALQTLEEEKKNSINEMGEVEDFNMNKFLEEIESKDFLKKDELKKAARIEIETNFIAAKRWLSDLKKNNFDINNDFTKIDGLYEKERHYKFLIDSIGYHVSEIRDTSKRFFEDKYFPSFMKEGIYFRRTRADILFNKPEEVLQ